MSPWIIDPETREVAQAIPSREVEIAYRRTHSALGWRSGVVRTEDGVPARIWYAPCRDACCAEFWANQPPLESMR